MSYESAPVTKKHPHKKFWWVGGVVLFGVFVGGVWVFGLCVFGVIG